MKRNDKIFLSIYVASMILYVASYVVPKYSVYDIGLSFTSYTLLCVSGWYFLKGLLIKKRLL